MIFDYVESIEDQVLSLRTSKLMRRVKELTLYYPDISTCMEDLEIVHDYCITNNFNRNSFMEYEKRFAAISQGSHLQENNLMKETRKYSSGGGKIH